MSFDTIEKSEYFEPQELYKFTRGVFSWFFTSGDTAISYLGNSYLPVPINRSKIESTQEIGKTTLNIDVSRRNPFVIQFIEAAPTDIITATVTRLHASDPDTAIIFSGRVINVSFKENEAKITCASTQSILKRPGLRRMFQTTCPHALYGSQCKALKVNFSIAATLTAVDGTLLTSTSFVVSIDVAFDATWLVGGIVEINTAGLVDKRFIVDHDNTSGTITLNLPLSNALVGSTVTVFPGCDRSPEQCNDKFSVIENYGGFPFIPEKNPMDGTSVF